MCYLFEPTSELYLQPDGWRKRCAHPTPAYGNSWRQQRKILRGLLNVAAVGNVLPLQNAKATLTLYQLLHVPEGWYDHIRRYPTAVILSSVYAQRAARFDSPKVVD